MTAEEWGPGMKPPRRHGTERFGNPAVEETIPAPLRPILDDMTLTFHIGMRQEDLYHFRSHIAGPMFSFFSEIHRCELVAPALVETQ